LEKKKKKKNSKETAVEIKTRMAELDQEDFDWDQWEINERDSLYFMEKVLGTCVDDDTYAMKIEAFKEALVRDPNFKQKGEEN